MCIREQGLPEKEAVWKCCDPKIPLYKEVIKRCQKKRNDFAILYNRNRIDEKKKVHEFRDTTIGNRLIIVVTKDLCKKNEVISYLFHECYISRCHL